MIVAGCTPHLPSLTSLFSLSLFSLSLFSLSLCKPSSASVSIDGDVELHHIAVPPYGLFCPSTALGTTMLSNPLQPVLFLISDRQFPSPGQSKRDPIKLPRPSKSLHLTMPYGSCMKLSRPQVTKGIQHMLGLSMASLDVRTSRAPESEQEKLFCLWACDRRHISCFFKNFEQVKGKQFRMIRREGF